MAQTALTEMFGMRYPIIQAPMAGAAGGDLAREVARGGGLGMVGTGTKVTTQWLDEQWERTGQAEPVGVGFMTWSLDADAGRRDLLRHALTLRPQAVLLSFGDPAPYIAAIKAAKAIAICQVQTVAQASQAVAAGADLLVAQGTEGGGHTGHEAMRPLLQAVLAVADGTPVVAAGGIGTGGDLAQVLSLGACGGMMGTRFVATPESMSHEQAKERIVQAQEGDTVLTRVFDLVQQIPWPAQYPGRALRNRFTDTWHGREADLVAHLPQAQKSYDSARPAMDHDTLSIYAGQVAGRISDIVPAAELVRRIAIEAGW